MRRGRKGGHLVESRELSALSFTPCAIPLAILLIAAPTFVRWHLSNVVTRHRNFYSKSKGFIEEGSRLRNEWVDFLPIPTLTHKHGKRKVWSSNGEFLDLEKRFIDSETVEKVPKQTFVGDAEKNDLTECTTINDLTIMKGHETLKNHLLTILKGFSTVSAAIEPLQNGVLPSPLRLFLSPSRYLLLRFEEVNRFGWCLYLGGGLAFTSHSPRCLRIFSITSWSNYFWLLNCSIRV